MAYLFGRAIEVTPDAWLSHYNNTWSDWALHASYATSFRAPDMNYIFQSQLRGYEASTTDYYRCGLSLVILIWAFRSVVLAVKAVLLNLVSLGAAVGYLLYRFGAKQVGGFVKEMGDGAVFHLLLVSYMSLSAC